MTGRRWGRITAAAAVALLMSACTPKPASTSTDKGRGPGPTPLPATSSHLPPATSDGPGLLNRIIQPDDATQLVVPGAPSGILTMAQLIARRHPGIPATDLPFNKAELVDLQFTVAAEKDWRTTDGSEIDIQLIQFTGQAAVATFRKDTYVSMLRDKTRFSNTAIDDFDPVTHPSLDAYGTRYESGPDAHGIETALFIAQGENVAIMIYVRAKAFNRATELTLFGLQQDAVGHN